MKNFIYLLAILLFSSSLALAQKSIAGKVTDENGEALIGATILAEGTVTGTATDVNGEFRLTLPNDIKAIVVSYTGFANRRVELTNEAFYNIALEAGAQILNDVVVIGYGSTSRKELTGSVAKVSAETISRLPITSLEQALQGNAPCVQVTTSSGTPGSSVSIRVRGPSSINASNQPLYVVDGVPINTGSVSQIGFGNQSDNVLATLNPAEIESIEVLKDAASAAIYGSRGANGVILITTKRGKAQKTQVNVSSYYGVQDVWKTIPTTTGPEYVALVQEMIVNRFGAGRLPSQSGLRGLDADPSTYPTTDWQSEIF